MINKVIDTIKKYDMFCRKEHVIVGVSGGCDSVALLYALRNIPYDLHLHVVHVNHMLRGEDAYLDAEYVRTICSKLNAELTILEVDVGRMAQETGVSEEEAGRNVRYESFFKEAKIYDCTKIAVAHHEDDQAETVLMRLLRGSGLKGLVGIPPSRDMEGIRIVRPFIRVRRSEIEGYCKSLGIEPRNDESNTDPKYLRNRIRNQLIPLLKEEYNPKVVETLVRSSELLREDQDYLENVTKTAYDDCLSETGYFDIAKLSKLHKAVQRRVLIKAYEDATKQSDFTCAQIVSVEELIYINRMGSSIDLRNNFVALIDYNGLTICERKEDVALDPTVFSIGEKVIWGDKTLSSSVIECRFEGKVDNRSLAKIAALNPEEVIESWAAFDLDELSQTLLIRGKNDGDKMIPFGMNHEKLLSDIFTDAKVSRAERMTCPLVCSGNDILWVCGIKTSNVAKVTSETKRILVIKSEDR